MAKRVVVRARDMHMICSMKILDLYERFFFHHSIICLCIAGAKFNALTKKIMHFRFSVEQLFSVWSQMRVQLQTSKKIFGKSFKKKIFHIEINDRINACKAPFTDSIRNFRIRKKKCLFRLWKTLVPSIMHTFDMNLMFFCGTTFIFNR